jgi:hypothetical protein
VITLFQLPQAIGVVHLELLAPKGGLSNGQPAPTAQPDAG